jgi:hypothetical protein
MDKTSKLHKQTVLGAADNITDLLQIAHILHIHIVKKLSVENFKSKEWLHFEHACVCIVPKEPLGRHKRTLSGSSIEYIEKAGVQAVDQFRIIAGTTFVGRTEPTAITEDSTKMAFEEIKLGHGQAEFMLLKTT